MFVPSCGCKTAYRIVGKFSDVQIWSKRRILRLSTAIHYKNIDKFRVPIPNGLFHCRPDLAAGIASCGRAITGKSLFRLNVLSSQSRSTNFGKALGRLEGSALLFQPLYRQCRILLSFGHRSLRQPFHC
jgi:hypothetical protein